MDRLDWARHWLCDMDGVLVRDGAMVPGADDFLDRLHETGRSYLIFTNNSFHTRRELSERLASMGLTVDQSLIWTSVLATAQFVHSQRPGGSAFVIGERSVHVALREIGFTESDDTPDYVILGETRDYSFDEFSTAVRLIEAGSLFVATNPEPSGQSPGGTEPGCGAMAALIQAATGVAPYFVGKPNSVMMREGLKILNAHSESTVVIGDRMDTDIRSGTEAGVKTILVLSGETTRERVNNYPYRPSLIVDSVADLITLL